jgi:hypothetical protein
MLDEWQDHQEACTANFHTGQQRKEPVFSSSLLEFDGVLGGLLNRFGRER